MTQLDFSREIASFDEKIQLAELEAAKAQERVKELQFQKARFNLEWINAVIKQQQMQAQAQPGAIPPQ